MPKLSVIIPVLNESSHLSRFVENLLMAPCPIDRELIFIDDGSVDGSYEILEQLSKQFSILVLRMDQNRGKGAAIRRGLEKSSGDFVVIQDADFEYDPRDLPGLLEPLLNDEADVVYGSRFQGGAPRNFHSLVNKGLTLLSNVCSGLRLTDMETCYKLFRADLIKSMQLTSDRFGIEVELTAYLGKTSARLRELPISYRPRSRLQGKKINWKDGVAALVHIVSFNLLGPKHPFHALPSRYRRSP